VVTTDTVVQPNRYQAAYFTHLRNALDWAFCHGRNPAAEPPSRHAALFRPLARNPRRFAVLYGLVLRGQSGEAMSVLTAELKRTF
jgi:hypothetical protein